MVKLMNEFNVEIITTQIKSTFLKNIENVPTYEEKKRSIDFKVAIAEN
jgi:hypothetical protein